MEPVTWALIAGAAVLILLLVLLAVRTHRRRKARARSGDLRERFGPEGERDLEERVERYRRSPARPLSTDDRRQVFSRWGELQAAYVDDPGVAIQRAEVLLRTILDRREMPSDHLDDRVTAAAFIRPELAEQYRKAHHVFVDVEAGRSSPEREHDQRLAFLVYRQLILDHIREPGPTSEDAGPVELREGDVPVTS